MRIYWLFPGGGGGWGGAAGGGEGVGWGVVARGGTGGERRGSEFKETPGYSVDTSFLPW